MEANGTLLRGGVLILNYQPRNNDIDSELIRPSVTGKVVHLAMHGTNTGRHTYICKGYTYPTVARELKIEI